jgi:molecular chaperone HtpG
VDKRIFEINPDHQIFEALNELVEKDGDNPRVKEYIDLLYDQALLLEGSKPRDPSGFAKNLSKLMVENTGRKDT